MNRKRDFQGRPAGNPGPIPERWLHCPRKAFTFVADKFLAFKTPLDNKFDSQVGEEHIFTPQMVFSYAKSKKVKIGLWFDLTKTERYYNKDVVEENGCKYVKLICQGHGEAPDENTVNLFLKICKAYIQQHPKELIGVHCTHGFNRTGFMIVSFLVNELDWSVEAAVNEFVKARPPGIYKGDYLVDLFSRYGDVEDAPPPPVLPSWCSESDDTPNEDTQPEEKDEEEGIAGGSSGEPKTMKHKGQVKAVFMEGIPRVKPVADMTVVSDEHKRIKNLTGFGSSGFPGCQPVSMDRQNIGLLQNPYKVSWKADGTRYMMYIDGSHQYFIDRDNALFQIEGLTFYSDISFKRPLVDTLVDGEMVIDKDPEGNQYPRYLIYDLISLEGNQISQESFTARMQAIQKFIIAPRHEALKIGKIVREREPIGIRIKEFFDLQHTGYLLGETFKQKLGHEPDGLVFQPINDPYKPGTCAEVLKWKPPSHNSVDFRLKIVDEHRVGMLPGKVGQLFVGGQNDMPFAEMKVKKALHEFNNKIIECRYEFKGKTGNWVFMRERTDKSFPNSFKTAQSVFRSISEPVTTEILLNYVHEVCGVPQQPTKQPVMPPPSRPPPHRPHRS